MKNKFKNKKMLGPVITMIIFSFLLIQMVLSARRYEKNW